MSLIPLIYAKNSVQSIDLSALSESQIDNLENDAIVLLDKRTRRSARGFVKKDTLQSRIHKTRVRLNIVKKQDPLPLLSRRYHLVPKDEVARLAKINKIYAEFKWRMPGHERQTQKSLVLGHALELAAELQDAGYYVFTHGQELTWGAFTDIITGLWRSRQSHQVDPFHRKWRREGSTLKWVNVAEYWKSEQSEKRDNDFNHSILSVDGIFSRTQYGESAFNTYWQSLSIHPFPIFANSIANFDCQDKDFRGQLIDFYKWVRAFYGSRINVIAIPKHLLKDAETCFVYRSHAYGKKCDCYGLEHENFINQLERHQQNIVKECESQYRILMYPLELHEEIRTFTFDSLSNENKDQFEQRKKEIIDKAVSLNLK